jgi:hypothetical protein
MGLRPIAGDERLSASITGIAEGYAQANSRTHDKTLAEIADALVS